MLYDSSDDLTLTFKTVLKYKVHICIFHIYILVLSLLPRLGEPLAHSLSCGSSMCVFVIFHNVTPTKSSKCLLHLSFFYSIDMIELLLPCGFDTLEYSWVKGYNWHLYACRLFCG
jgi:hypothetical protein